MRARRVRWAALPIFLLIACAVAGRAGAAPAAETLHYKWHLEGFLGAIAGLFMPDEGVGSLTHVELPDGRWRSELLITVDGTTGGDFFRYGSEWVPATGVTERAWSSQRWRGEPKQKASEIGQTGVIDIATAVHLLRLSPPREPLELEIWSDGKLYPVLVEPRGVEDRKVGGRTVAARHFTVRPLVRPERRVWKGEMDLWLAIDERSTPVEIRVARSSARVRLELVQGLSPATAGAAAAEGEAK